MTQVKTGDTVQLHYTGTLADGATFDSSRGRDPLQFEVGSGQIIPGLDKALPGMIQVEIDHLSTSDRAWMKEKLSSLGYWHMEDNEGRDLVGIIP